MMLTVCLNGAFVIEQPSLSLFQYYPRLRDLWENLRSIGGPHVVPCQISQVAIHFATLQIQSIPVDIPWMYQDVLSVGYPGDPTNHVGTFAHLSEVHRVDWWMALYGGPTPKRHLAFSNSATISKLQLGKLQCWNKQIKAEEEQGISRPKTVRKYVDKQGHKRFQGAEGLRPSESETKLFTKIILIVGIHHECLHFLFLYKCLPSLFRPRNYPAAFGKKLTTLWKEMIETKKGMPVLPEVTPSGLETFSEMTFDDPWQEADVVGVIHWLRGSRDLAIPNEWRQVLPHKL